MTKINLKAHVRKLEMCETDLDAVLCTLTRTSVNSPEIKELTNGRLDEAIELLTQAAHAVTLCRASVFAGYAGAAPE